MRILLFSALVFALAACEAKTPVRPDFDAALERHLAAIAARDIEAYGPTIADDLYLIFPDGTALTKRDEVLAFHDQWFEDPDWVMTPEIVRTIVGADMATALIKYDYRDTADAAPRAAWLVLVFKLEDGAWKLVHDQNTRIVETAEEDV